MCLHTLKSGYPYFVGFLGGGREISISAAASYEVASDLGDFFEAMRSRYSASIAAEGVKAALEDGAALAAIDAKYGFGEEALQAMAEEIHASI